MTYEQDRERKLEAIRRHDDNAEEGWFWLGNTVAAFVILGVVIYSLSSNGRTMTASQSSATEQTTQSPAAPKVPSTPL